METLWHMHNFDLYSILCPSKINNYFKNNGLLFKKGEVIYFPEDTEQKLYLVSKGKVKLCKYNQDGEEIVKLLLTKGEIFGEKVLLGQNKREEYAIAEGDNTALCLLSIDKMRQLMRDNERFGLFIYKLIGLRVKKIERRLEILVCKDAEERLIEFIKDIFDDNFKDGEIVKHHYSQNDIAKLIGTSRETVSKLMSKYKKQGIIDYTRTSITLKNKEELLSYLQQENQ
ncbi:Crp/Fnr family transcriptional regulator [Flammeovirga kamogawensis]|uniref:Crp/Fnr family transcriptional regulator n=1 Tax=Flammeovirga kamogawensis TaxID=373891 RepID=A0ABX8GVR7_9BACT|nr:Crp/Fnr family transcriptional regulator [Flammeovirga kamogawensis]MBB6461580.1 CRP-like cAMP-binding protein [Flammeovirga kamogawensis]QWG07489.1 Crp/Fnr family transcriptional regulator [Flammeovirga kamogawensis]TRX69302.1 Crp/Fnr family transcriptional regulator [Flammeovirga kamogawensis]